MNRAINTGKTILVLGSSSPRRSALLRQIGAHFEIVAADIDETMDDAAAPGDYVSALALKKASAAAGLVRNNVFIKHNYYRAIVIGADTTVVAHNGEILGKPADGADAARMLGLLSGRWHEVYTGVALADVRFTCIHDRFDALDGRLKCPPIEPISGYGRTSVKMCPLDGDTIKYYVGTGEAEGKAGAYAIQGAGSLFIERVEGCYYNVVGLPLHLLRAMLGAYGYDLLKINSQE